MQQRHGSPAQEYIPLAYGNMLRKIKNNVPDIVTQTGKVSTHASRIFWIVPFSRFDNPPEANMAPAIPEERTWVVLTGNPK
jgi:hypothetical protein